MTTYYKLSCSNCNASFEREARQMPWNKTPGRYNTKKECLEQGIFYCSYRCMGEGNDKRITRPCGNCEKPVTRPRTEFAKSKSGYLFCNRSCSATFNNKNKSCGTRRSKLEVYIEECIRKDFPNLKLECNSKVAIGSELDFYFPDLLLAIELNGIFHYEPIYGQDKLEKIQNNDQQKLIRCAEKGIELCIIDSSACNYLTQKAKNKYYSIVRDLVTSISKRAE